MERPRFMKPGNEQLYPSFSSKSRTPDPVNQIVLPTTDQQKLSDADAETTFVYNRHLNLPLEAQRQKLPIFQYRNHVLYLLERFQTLVLVGETGSGKSTQVPQYLLESGYCRDGNRVVVTQPRVAAAASLARRVADERGVECGGAVGFAVSLHTECGEGTRIKYVTEGVLLREMFADPLLTNYSCVMLDEVHERSQLTDTLMGLLKKILRKRKTLKLIVSSATMDADFLRDFFNLKKARGEGEQATSVILSVEGRSHPIDVFYVEEPVPDYVKATVETVIKIQENEPFGDILAFLTSQEEISTALSALSDYARDNNEKNHRRRHHPSGIQAADMLVLPLYGTLPFGDQLRVFQSAGRNVRKVVLATNVAETSLTIPGVVYVIDCGFHKIRYVNPETGLESLVVCPVSRNNATQRAGRAGRQTRGKCYRLYTEDDYEKFFPAVPPEMQRSDLSAILLQLKAFGIDNLLRFSFPSPPPARALLSGLETLLALGALDFEGHLTEPLGVRMAELPLQPFLAKCLCASDEFGVIEEMLSIVSMLQVENIFVKPSYGQKAIAAKVAKRNNFSVEEGDLMTYLNVCDAYVRVTTDSGNSSKAAREWCKKCFVSERSMARVAEVRASLSKMVYGKFKMENAKFDGPDLGSGKCTRILRCLTAGLFPRACFLHHSGVYRLLSGDGVDLHISPDSCLYDFQQPQWLVFASVSSSGDKTYIRDLVNIRKEWLCELAPHFYKES